MDLVIDKIKKLLRLSRSSNPNEAQQALRRALELSRQHAIDIDGLDPDEQAKEKTITHRDTDPRARMTYDHRYAWSICRIFFNIDTVTVQCVRMVNGWPRNGTKMMVVGTEADISIGIYVQGFIVQHFSYCWRHHRGRLRNRQAYIHGMYRGIFSNLYAKQPSQDEERANALVEQERENYISRVIGETTSKPMKEPDHAANAASWRGYQQGLKTNISMPLAEGEKTENLALK